MKALFVGLGSIGRRHLKNLSALCESRGLELEVSALRSTQRALPEDTQSLVHHQIQTFPHESFDLAFITNPTHLHALAIGELNGQVDTFFIEKPVFDHPGYDLAVLGLSPRQKAYVAAPMRWTALYAALKEQLKTQQVYAARAICSSYLPSWRGDVDYRHNYSAHREMGGGVSLDLIHEWDYLYDLFGAPLETKNICGQFSHLEIDSDDISLYIARWENMAGELHLDYFGREYRRQLELYCESGTITADFSTGALTLTDGTVQDHSEDANCNYIREMDYFLNYALIGPSESVNSPQLALTVLKTAVGDC